MKAKALYDNVSEDDEELSFRKNDVLEVLERDYDGMEGWWLCSLNGVTGIAPGNRLMPLSGSNQSTDYDLPKNEEIKIQGNDYDTPNKKISSHIQSLYDVPVPNNNKTITLETSQPNQQKNQEIHTLDSTFISNYQAFKKSEKETKSSASQILNMAPKWIKCRKSNSVQTVAKVVSVNLWKHLQSYLAELSKLLLLVKPLLPPKAEQRNENMKKISSELEEILEKMNRNSEFFCENLKLLEININLVQEELIYFCNFFEKFEKEKEWRNIKNVEHIPGFSSTSNPCSSQASLSSSFDYDLPKQNNKMESPFSQQLNRLRKSTQLLQVTDYDQPKSHDFLDQLPSEYDLPNPSNPSKSSPPGVADKQKKCLSVPIELTSKETVEKKDINSKFTSTSVLDYDYPIKKDKQSKNYEKQTSLNNKFNDEIYQNKNLTKKDLETKCDDEKITIKNKLIVGHEQNISINNLVLNKHSNQNKNSSSKNNEINNKNLSVENKNVSLSDENLEREISFLKYYKPYLLTELELTNSIIENIKIEKEKVINSNKHNNDEVYSDLIENVKFLICSSHKIMFILESACRRIKIKLNLLHYFNSICIQVNDLIKLTIYNVKSFVTSRQESEKNNFCSKFVYSISELERIFKDIGKINNEIK